MSKFSQRMYSAMLNGESLILDQVIGDIESTRIDGSIDTVQYSMKRSGDDVIIYDKINGEYTRAFGSTDISLVDHEIKERKSPLQFKQGSSFIK